MRTRRKIKIRNQPSGLKKNSSRILFRTMLAFFAGSIIYTLFFSGFLRVSLITVEGNESLDPEEIRKGVQKHIFGKYLGILEKNNLILVSGKKIEGELLREFKKVEKAAVKKKFPSEIKIMLKERQSVLFLCASDLCYVVSENGMAFDTVENEVVLDGANKVVTLRDNGGGAVEMDKIVLAKDYLDYVRQIPDVLKREADIQTKFSFETPGIVSSDIRGETEDGWRIFLSTEIDLKKEAEMLRVVLENTIKERRKDLEYVDLRSDNKVFYKFKGETQSDTEIKQNDTEVKGEEDKKDDDKKKDKKKKKS